MPQEKNKNLFARLASMTIAEWFLIISLILGFALQLYLIYFGYRTYGYLVPPGSDAIQHYNIIKQILDTGQIDFLSYPPGFHLLVIFLSKIFSVGTFHILTYWTPVLVVLPALCMYFLLRQLFDQKTSTITTLLFLLTSGYPIYNFIDGNYPDILAYGVFGILLFAFLIRYLRTKNSVNLIISSVFLLLIAVTHHLTFVGILAVLGLFSLVQLYILIAEHKIHLAAWSWKTLTGLAVALLVALSLYFAFRFYGATIMQFVTGFFTNDPALKNNYLNQAVDWSNYPLFSGGAIWYIGLFGLLFLIVTTFQARYEVGAKQLVLVWFAFYFIMSRLASSGLPARFARELVPPLVVAIGFLFNYIFNLNSLRIHRYKLILGYGLMAFLIITSSALYIGPAKIPDAFNLMIWFWPKDQQELTYIDSYVSENYGVLYNPAANLYLPIKAPSSFVPFILNSDQLAIATMAQNDPNYSYNPFDILSDKKISKLTGFNKLIYDLTNEFKYKYIFIGVKPPSNPDPVAYPAYAQFNIYDMVLRDMGKNGNLVKEFPDGSELIKMH